MRVIRLYLVLIVVFFGAMLTIHLIGGLMPNPVPVLFTNPDGSPCQMPCLFGVRPGVTTVEEGLQILDKHPLTHNLTVERDQQSATLYDENASIDLSSLLPGSRQIDQIELSEKPSADQSATSHLLQIMRQSNPGNQFLYFADPANESGQSAAQPPYVNTYCYDDDRVCFETVQWDDSTPQQSEQFSSLTISSGTSN